MGSLSPTRFPGLPEKFKASLSELLLTFSRLLLALESGVVEVSPLMTVVPKTIVIGNERSSRVLSSYPMYMTVQSVHLGMAFKLSVDQLNHQTAYSDCRLA